MPNMKILGPTGVEIDLNNNEYFYFINMDSQCFFFIVIYLLPNRTTLNRMDIFSSHIIINFKIGAKVIQILWPTKYYVHYFI